MHIDCCRILLQVLTPVQVLPRAYVGVAYCRHLILLQPIPLDQ